MLRLLDGQGAHSGAWHSGSPSLNEPVPAKEVEKVRDQVFAAAEKLGLLAEEK